jgi:Ca2+/H+ antiporter
MSAALAMIQQATFKTPDTTGYAYVGYTAIVVVLAAYALFLWIRLRNTKK